jgi:hypothetical protein
MRTPSPVVIAVAIVLTVVSFGILIVGICLVANRAT